MHLTKFFSTHAHLDLTALNRRAYKSPMAQIGLKKEQEKKMLNIHDFNTIREAVIHLANSKEINEATALDLLDKVNALRVSTIKTGE